ncbi:MAG: AraC family transcriptional regulator [Clostridia bacterium]|jgi:AraC-like DNA-binding protein/quercetin dioxygenase-like cupin family protein|nr:AraC family transcriptional regulator [Clostridia bacterium]
MKDLKLYESIPSLENNFAVKFREYENDSALIPHWHEHIEMMLLCDGECDFHVDGRSYSARPGDLIVVNSAQIHSFTVKGRIRFYSLLLFPSFFDDVSDKEIKISGIVRDDERVREYFDEMHREYTADKKMSDMMLKGCAYRLVAYLGRKYSVEHKEQSPDSQKLKRLYSLLEYISNNYSERISTKDLAAYCFVSEEHLCRFFKKTVGKTVSEYVNQYRVEKAAVLLSNTDDTVGDVGASVGFEDINYFSRIFKRIKGLTPSEYRRIAAQKQDK